jgi:hypothetical protein
VNRFENEAEFGFVPAATRVVLNVGGQVFESTAEVLCRDRFRYARAISVIRLVLQLFFVLSTHYLTCIRRLQ